MAEINIIVDVYNTEIIANSASMNMRAKVVPGCADLEKALIDYLRTERDLLIGEPQAERILYEFGYSLRHHTDQVMKLKGRNMKTGLPDQIEIDRREVRQAVEATFNQMIAGIIKLVQEFIQQNVYPDTVSEILLRGSFQDWWDISERLEKALGIKIIVSETHEPNPNTRHLIPKS